MVPWFWCSYVVAEGDPFCALHVSSGNFEINTMDHMKMSKNSAFVREGLEGMKSVILPHWSQRDRAGFRPTAQISVAPLAFVPS